MPKKPKQPKKPEPGTFHDSGEDLETDRLQARIHELFATRKAVEIYGDKDDDPFVRSTTELAKRFNLLGKDVLYPGSASHVGAARVFGADKVVHVDPAVLAVRALNEQGLTAISSTIEEYEPDKKFGVIISFNAGVLEHDTLDRLLAKDGFVIANNWHGSANQMVTYDDFELVAAIVPDYRSGEIVTEGAADYLGSDVFVIDREGKVVTDEGAAQSGSSIEMPRSADALFLFSRKQ